MFSIVVISWNMPTTKTYFVCFFLTQDVSGVNTLYYYWGTIDRARLLRG